MTTKLEIELKADELDFLAKAAFLVVPDYDVVLFGSRVRGDSRWYSDLDVAVFGDMQPFDIKVTRFLAVLKEAGLSVIPGITQMSTAKPEYFIQNVLKEGVLAHEGCGEFNRLRKESGLPLQRSIFTPPVGLIN